MRTVGLTELKAEYDKLPKDAYSDANKAVEAEPYSGEDIALQTDVFFESDVPHNYGDRYKINALAVYKDRLYAGCDGGLVIMFTDCAKCYKLKKAWDKDIKEMSIVGGKYSEY